MVFVVKLFFVVIFAIVGAIAGLINIYKFINSNPYTQARSLSVFGLIVAGICLVAAASVFIYLFPGSTSSQGATSPSPTPNTSFTPTPAATAAPTSNTSVSSSPTGQAPLTPQEVQSWCYTIPNGGTCDISRFVQFRRVDGTVLPYAVQMLGGEPVGIKLPAGFTASVWDCYHQNNDVHGQKDLTRVCTLSVARGQKEPD